MSEKKPHIIFRILKLLGWFVLSLGIILVALRFSLKSSWVHNLVKNQVVSAANNNLNGTLSIEAINGDLWNDFSISGIMVTQSDTVLTVNSIGIKYDIRQVLNRTFTASEILISGLYTNVKETEEKEFNILQLIKTDTTSLEQTEPSASTFGINIQKIELDESSVFIYSPSFLPDTTLSVKQLYASGEFNFYEELSASLASLSFELIEGRLPEPITFNTSGDFRNQKITLNELVIGTGRSMLQTSGNAHIVEQTLDASAETRPFSLKDIQPYLDMYLPDDELQIQLGTSGTFDLLSLEVKAESHGFDDLILTTELSLSEIPTINKIGISGRQLDLAYFTNDSLDARIGSFNFYIDGPLNTEFTASNAEWRFTLHSINYESYTFEKLSGNGILENEKLIAAIQLNNRSESIALNAEIRNLFSEKPFWNLRGNFSNIDLGWWAQDPELEGVLSFSLLASGTRFTLSESPWKYEIFTRKAAANSYPIWLAGQKISEIHISGTLTQQILHSNGFVQFTDNKISFSSSINDFLNDTPSYQYSLKTRGFDAREFEGFEDFPTDINLTASGSGRYFDPNKIQLQTNIIIDSSFVNGARFNLLDIEAALENNILVVSKGSLDSEVLGGTFTGRRNLADETDPDNDIAIDLQVKNLQPLAALAGVDVLNATGSVSGNIIESTKQELTFNGRVQLNNIHYDTLFTANAIAGNTIITIGDGYAYDINLDITEPVYSGFGLQDIAFASQGVYTADSVGGTFQLDIYRTGTGQILQSGNYSLNLETLQTDLRWHTFEFETPVRTLNLQAPFHLTYKDASIRTDTLMLRSGRGTYLNVAIPYADSLEQYVWAEGRDFDFGVIQEIIFDERFVDGILSGDFQINKSPEELSGKGQLVVSSLAYKGTNIDLLDLNFNIDSERLNARLNLSMKGEEKIVGFLDIPFVVADPADLDDSFFNEPVYGELTINPVQLSEFENLLNAVDVTGTKGILSFNGKLSGTAGEPDMEGVFNLGQPTLSGINIDSAFARFRYHHLEEKLIFLSEINARGQKAASINAELPLSMDFRTFELNMPDKTDSLTINLRTDEFNISVFNDFLNKEYMDQLQGFLNADIDITGTMNTLVPSGFLRLTNSRVSVPIAGITLSQINSELRFVNNRLQLVNLNAVSGSGNFTANGFVDLEGIIPTNLDITARAGRFRLANTSDYNLTIDLNSRLSGQPTRPTASGVLTIKNGFVFLQDFGERSVETVELEGEETSSFSPYDSLAIDMQFVIERDFLIRNRRYLDMEVELIGELDAQKQTNSDLQLFGTLTAHRGYVRPLGKRFILDEGTFTFSGPLTEPDIYIKTNYIPQTSQKQGTPITLYYIIEGNALDPEYRFESDPQMEQQDIICYTLFNKPCYALESWQQVVSGGGGSSPTDMLVDVLLDEVEAIATQQLGIDVVQIDNTRTGSGSGTSIKTGWYLNQRTFFAIVNEISGSTPKTLFILEYLLTSKLDLIITQGDDNRQGIDFRWQFDY